MIIKFETKSARVKGVAFHPRRKWVLTSLHNGTIQLWDYLEKTLIDKFEEHHGPVRGLDFHSRQPLFVSGGDDAKIKVWNYKQRKCLFTIDAHEDYIRTTFFHHEHPWIISCSDDQTIRIWNWQSRSRIAYLTGHTHFVMCAHFHPTAELILSASVDQTLRLWDITGLKMKNTSSNISSRSETNAGLPEILSKTDYTVESKEAHMKEVNWCAFHPDANKQYCLSASDDNSIKLWKVDSRGGMRELDTLRGHYYHVHCAIFHPKEDMVVSASADRSIRVWDIDKRSAILTHRREDDRFWVLAAHQNENLFAAGHDSGMMIFKLVKERPVFKVLKEHILFIKGKQLCAYSTKTQEKRVVATLKPKTDMCHRYYRIDCHSISQDRPSEVTISTRSNVLNKSIFDVYNVNFNRYGEVPDSQRYHGLVAIYFGPRRLVGVDFAGKVNYKIQGNTVETKIENLVAEDVFNAGPGRFFVKGKIDGVDSISLWDAETSSRLGFIKTDAKYVVISENRNHIACVCANKILICDGKLNLLATVTEQRKIKSAAWEESGVLIYTTPVHVKYALTDGDSTTIVSVQHTLYIMAVRDNRVYCIDRNCEIKQIPIDYREFKFKQAVIRNDRGAILSALKALGNLTRAEISFLVRKGYPGLALKFVKDDANRFPLALQAFDIPEALKAAQGINNSKCWTQLAEVAMQVGNVETAEIAFKKLKKPYKLAMLYLTSNQRDKMLEAREFAKELNDTSTEFLISLLVKDFAGCAQIIRRSGNPSLAYTCAINHGLNDLARDISQELEPIQLDQLPPLDSTSSSTSWMPQTIPDIGNSKFTNWPLLKDEHESFENVLANEEQPELEVDDDGDWGEEEFKSQTSEKEENGKSPAGSFNEEDGWDDEEILEDFIDEEDLTPTAEEESFKVPSVGQSIISKWSKSSEQALHHVLAGSYQTALSLLKSQANITNTEPFRDIVLDLFLQSRVAVTGGSALYPTTYIHPFTADQDYDDMPTPIGGYKLEDLEKRLTECYNLFSSGKFDLAVDKFRSLLLSTLFVQTDEDGRDRIAAIIDTCKEYILGLLIWLKRKSIKGKEFEDNKEACELAAYFSSLNLHKHRSKVLEKALEVFLVKPKEFQATKAASSIARRLLDYLDSTDEKKAKMFSYATKVKNSFDVELDRKIGLDYDDMKEVKICSTTLKPSRSVVKCGFCKAYQDANSSNETCNICLVAGFSK